MPRCLPILALVAGCASPAADTGPAWPDPPPQLEPVSVPCPVASLAFASASAGVIACADRPEVAVTADGGGSWAREPLPGALVPQVVAATPQGSFRAVDRGDLAVLTQGSGTHVLDAVAVDEARWALLLVRDGRQILHVPGLRPPPAGLPGDFEANALAIDPGGRILVGGEWEGAEGDPHAVLVRCDSRGWIRLSVPPDAGAVEDLAVGPPPSGFVAVGRATLAGDGGYALASRDPAVELQVRLAPVPLVEAVTAGAGYLARGSDGSLWRGEFPPL